MVIRGYTSLYMVIRGYTWLYLVIHGYTWLYRNGYTWLYRNGYTWLYVVIHGYYNPLNVMQYMVVYSPGNEANAYTTYNITTLYLEGDVLHKEVSNALIKPTAKVTATPLIILGKCPKNICRYKRERAGRPWVQCTQCDQWCHCQCVGLSREAADELSEWFCSSCTIH